MGSRAVNTSDTQEVTFQQCYEEHYGAVLAYCRRRVGGADAQDATAEVFTIVWRKIDDLPDHENLRSWLFGIAYRVVGHQWRSQRRYRRLRDRVAGVAERVDAGPELVVVQREQDRRVLAAAKRLRSADQEILRLAGWEALPHAEIAEVLGISIAAVDQRFHRAKQRLAREYDRITGRPDRGGAE